MNHSVIFRASGTTCRKLRGDVTKERAVNSIYALNTELLDIPVLSGKKHCIRSLQLSEFSEEKLMLKGLF